MDENKKPRSRKKRDKTSTTIRVGSRIKSLRLKKKLSQARVAESSGISSKYLGEVERGEANISVELVGKVAQGLGVPMAAIMENEHEQPHQELVDAIIRLAPELSEKDAQIVYRMMKMLTE
jgi:transcriptional regulator with XRE-family HTH domain